MLREEVTEINPSSSQFSSYSRHHLRVLRSQTKPQDTTTPTGDSERQGWPWQYHLSKCAPLTCSGTSNKKMGIQKPALVLHCHKPISRNTELLPSLQPHWHSNVLTFCSHAEKPLVSSSVWTKETIWYNALQLHGAVRQIPQHWYHPATRAGTTDSLSLQIFSTKILNFFLKYCSETINIALLSLHSLEKTLTTEGTHTHTAVQRSDMLGNTHYLKMLHTQKITVSIVLRKKK